MILWWTNRFVAPHANANYSLGGAYRWGSLGTPPTPTIITDGAIDIGSVNEIIVTGRPSMGGY